MMSKRIKQKRTELGITQEELADRLGMQKSAIAKYENGRVTNIKRSVVKEMAAIFDVSPAWLMGLDESASEEQFAVSIGVEEDLAHWKKYANLSRKQKDLINQMIDSLCDLP